MFKHQRDVDCKFDNNNTIIFEKAKTKTILYIVKEYYGSAFVYSKTNVEFPYYYVNLLIFWYKLNKYKTKVQS